MNVGMAQMINAKTQTKNIYIYETRLFNHILHQAIVHMAQGCEDILLPLCTHLKKW
jgi:hypothetical protein